MLLFDSTGIYVIYVIYVIYLIYLIYLKGAHACVPAVCGQGCSSQTVTAWVSGANAEALRENHSCRAAELAQKDVS